VYSTGPKTFFQLVPEYIPAKCPFPGLAYIVCRLCFQCPRPSPRLRLDPGPWLQSSQLTPFFFTGKYVETENVSRAQNSQSGPRYFPVNFPLSCRAALLKTVPGPNTRVAFVTIQAHELESQQKIFDFIVSDNEFFAYFVQTGCLSLFPSTKTTDIRNVNCSSFSNNDLKKKI
jgi:hypothetical protein